MLRAARLIGFADKMAARVAAGDAAAANAAYRAAHPGRVFPDPMRVFEVAGHARLDHFDRSGASDAARLAALLSEAGVAPTARVLEWGCGPARILAHLPGLMPQARLDGCDPDSQSIAFAQVAHANAEFRRIAPLPPTPYADAAFDAIYGISVLTHLNEAAAQMWIGELARILAPGGVLILTTHGEDVAQRLSPAQRARFDAGQYVALGGASIGSRTYAAYMNEAAGRRLFAPWFSQMTFRPFDGTGFGQDLWRLGGPRVGGA